MWYNVLSLVCCMYRVEMKFDPSGRPYYVDHNTRTTSWTRPTPLPPGSELPSISTSCFGARNCDELVSNFSCKFLERVAYIIARGLNNPPTIHCLLSAAFWMKRNWEISPLVVLVFLQFSVWSQFQLFRCSHISKCCAKHMKCSYGLKLIKCNQKYFIP